MDQFQPACALMQVAKKATVLNRDEMVKMRQQADPNFKNAPLAKKGEASLMRQSCAACTSSLCERSSSR